VHKLSKLLNGLDQRNNILVAFVLNGLMFWDLRQMRRIEAWKEAHASQLPDWLDALGEMDAYCSLATFAYNHPDYVYPRVAVDSFCLKATAMGHPLMRRDKCVRNDVCNHRPAGFPGGNGCQRWLARGSYLRTVGVNYLMACAGSLCGR
jgi:DNA mismatch repair ATPase MutS